MKYCVFIRICLLHSQYDRLDVEIDARDGEIGDKQITFLQLSIPKTLNEIRKPKNCLIRPRK